MKQDETMVTVSSSTRDKVKVAAVLQGKTMKAFIEEALQEFIEKNKAKK